MEDFAKLVDAECDRGIKKHGHLNSYHEGLAVLWEEFEELKAEVFAQKADIDNMRTELVQIAAVCKKFWQQTFGKEYYAAFDTAQATDGLPVGAGGDIETEN